MKEVKISLNKNELEGFALICEKQIDGIERSILFLLEDDTSYNSFEKNKLEQRRELWLSTSRKIYAAIEVITTINGDNDGDEKITNI